MTKDCSLNYKFSTWKFQAQNTCRTICVHNMFCGCSELAIFMYWTLNSMNNLLSYCGLVDAKIRASDKDLPFQISTFSHHIPQPTLIFNREKLQNFKSQSGLMRYLDYIALNLTRYQNGPQKFFSFGKVGHEKLHQVWGLYFFSSHEPRN